MGLGLLLYPLYALVYFFMKTSKDGAQTNIYCCVAEDCADETGRRFNRPFWTLGDFLGASLGNFLSYQAAHTYVLIKNPFGAIFKSYFG